MTRTTLTITPSIPVLALALAAPLTSGCKNQCGGSLHEACDTTIGTTSESSSGTTETSTTTSGPGTSTTTGVNTTTATSTDPTEASTTQTSSSTTGPTPTCGDNKTDAGEECDNGPDNADDAACTYNCTLAKCGDNLTQTGVEECDNGPDNADDAACTSTCTLAKCGDSLIQKDIEECDDGNADPHDGCSDKCYIERLVFVTSTAIKGGFGGLSMADTFCQDRAEMAGLTTKGQIFMAWLSVNGMPPQSPSTRFPEAVTTAKGPFLLPDDAHTKIADNWITLVDGGLDASISVTEMGSKLTQDDDHLAAWTATDPKGAPTQPDCSGWSSKDSGVSGQHGQVLETTGTWTQADNDSACDSLRRFYCFQTSP